MVDDGAYTFECTALGLITAPDADGVVCRSANQDRDVRKLCGIKLDGIHSFGMATQNGLDSMETAILRIPKRDTVIGTKSQQLPPSVIPVGRCWMSVPAYGDEL